MINFGRLAQLVRACDLHSQGQGFKPSSAHHALLTQSEVKIKNAKVKDFAFCLLNFAFFRARGVAWFNMSDCRSEDREFKSRRARH